MLKKETVTCLDFIQKVKNSNNINMILFSFDLSPNGNRKLNKRMDFIDEFYSHLSFFNKKMEICYNTLAPKLLSNRIFKGFECSVCFDLCKNMSNVCRSLLTSLSGKINYKAPIANIIIRCLPELYASLEVYFENYLSMDSIIHKNIKLIENMFSENEINIIPATLLISPIQLLPRYWLLITDIERETPKWHFEFPLFSRLKNEIQVYLSKLDTAHSFTEVSSLQKRLVPLKENKDKSLVNDERFLVKKCLINHKKCCLYLLSDLIVFTRKSSSNFTEVDIEKFRCNYDEFFFIPNQVIFSIICYYDQKFKELKFESNEEMNDMIEIIKDIRLKLFDKNPDKDNTLLACEISPKNQIVTPINEPSCCKDESKFYFISQKNLVVYDSMHESIKIMKSKMNIHSHSKLFNFKSSICLYGGSKCPIPIILQSDKFVPYPIINKNQNESLNYLILVDPP